MIVLRRVVPMIALLLAGCSSSPDGGGADGGTPIEDASVVADAAPATVDLASGVDLASAAGDLADAVDLANRVDLASGLDLANVADLAQASDLGDATCVDVGAQTPVVVATAGSADEFALTLDAQSASATSWAQAGNEALLLDVLRSGALVGHLVLHAGAAKFHYGMQVGALAAGDAIALRVSARSAAGATRQARVCGATLQSATQLGAAGEGLKNAPILLWPAKKSFDDLPILLGWSQATQHYELVYTNENGGTTVSCGSGATGMRAELARWGRGADIENVYNYGATKNWLRCTGTATVSANSPRMDGAHPIFYYGDGHNRLYESRGGYGNGCGSGGPEKADGDLVGWNSQNPGNDPAHDADFTITLRPLPVDLDAIGYAASSGRREGLIDSCAPWLYRITDEELTREGKVDGVKTLPLERYLYVDVQAADVDGSGDRVCSATVSGGFVLRVKTASGATLDGPQMTSSYMGGSPAWKRLAIPLDRQYAAAELTGMTFDAYDKDGIYLLAIGDAFMVRPRGDNDATLERLRSGVKTFGVYVDDDNSSCVNGVNHDGPGGGAFPCAGSAYDFTP